MFMEILPAIDVMGGKCVQLVGGRPETKKDYGSPIDKALEWKSKGANMLHIVDLDATLGTGSNFDVARGVKNASGLPVEFGGGLRSIDDALRALRGLGSEDRIILGTLAVSEYPDFKTLKALGDYKDRIIVSVDSMDGFVAMKGWTQKSKLKADELMSACVDLVWGFLYTNVDVEGQMRGINKNHVEYVLKATRKPVIVSGGISRKADVEACRKAGAWGVVLGKALYEGKMELEDVIL
jgi:phosphoribosylformimino-5-aminoimidazole carboxamide ribotide isomerase